MTQFTRHTSTALVITAGSSPGGYDIIRTLGKEGIRVSVASSQHDDIAFRSRYCYSAVRLPEFNEAHHDEILATVLAWGACAEEKPVLYYVSDGELEFVCRFKRELASVFRFLLPPDNILEPLFNKVKFRELGRQYEFPLPETLTFKSAQEMRAHLKRIPLPCIVKPAYSQDWVWDTPEQEKRFGAYKSALRRFESLQTLLEFCEELPKRNAGFLIQSYIDGRDENIVSFHGYFDETSRCLSYFLGRKIRTYPPHTGGSAYIRTIHEPRLATLSIDLLQRINFQGIVKIDFKRDADSFKIFEINTRYNLWQLLGAYAGANLALVAYRHQRGEPIPPQNGYADDARLLFLKQDLRAYWGGYRRIKEWSFMRYILSYLGNNYYRVFDPADPTPFYHSMIGFLKRRVNAVLQMVFPERQATAEFHLPRSEGLGAENTSHGTQRECPKGTLLVAGYLAAVNPALSPAAGGGGISQNKQAPGKLQWKFPLAGIFS